MARTFFDRPYHAGHYVDIGCFRPIKWSNTYAFYLRGWSGLCVDPNENLAAAWAKYRPRDRFVNRAVSEHEGNVEYVRSAKGAAENWVRSGQASRSGGEVVPAERLAGLLEGEMPVSQTIDLMSVDCEGHDLSVLRSNDWERFRPHVLIVEDKADLLTGDLESHIHSFMLRHEYKLTGRCHISSIYLDTMSRDVGSPEALRGPR